MTPSCWVMTPLLKGHGDSRYTFWEDTYSGKCEVWTFLANPLSKRDYEAESEDLKVLFQVPEHVRPSAPRPLPLRGVRCHRAIGGVGSVENPVRYWAGVESSRLLINMWFDTYIGSYGLRNMSYFRLAFSSFILVEFVTFIGLILGYGLLRELLGSLWGLHAHGFQPTDPS